MCDQTSTSSSPSSNSSFEEFYQEPESPTKRVRSITKIYESCDVAFFTWEPQISEEADNEEIWTCAMDNEIASIGKKTHENLQSFLKKEM